MYTANNPVIVTYQTFAVSSVIIFPLLFMLIRQQFTNDYSFPVIFVFSCLIGLICSFTLLLKFELPKFAFPGIAIHLFSLFMVTCC